MSSSSNNKVDAIFAIYNDSRTVFRLNDIAMLIGEENFMSVNQKLNYYVRTGKLSTPRKGIYTKALYNPEELVCVLYTPSYISLEYVLQKAGVIFQYDSRITSVSYLSRSLDIGNKAYSYRKIKGEILVEKFGIRQENNINIAMPERAFLDLLYLSKEFYFDNLKPLDRELIYKLLPIYGSNAVTQRVDKLLKNV